MMLLRGTARRSLFQQYMIGVAPDNNQVLHAFEARFNIQSWPKYWHPCISFTKYTISPKKMLWMYKRFGIFMFISSVCTETNKTNLRYFTQNSKNWLEQIIGTLNLILLTVRCTDWAKLTEIFSTPLITYTFNDQYNNSLNELLGSFNHSDSKIQIKHWEEVLMWLYVCVECEQ